MIIDVYAHHISRRVGKLLSNEKYYGEGKEFKFAANNADPEFRLSLMDKYGVDVQALSQTTPVLLGFNAAEATEICRLSNDDNYALCKAYPKRFVNICMVSMLDVKSAVNEVERSVSDLDCRGITVSTNENGKGLDSPEYYPFYDMLVKHDLPLFLHPTHWESYPLVSMEDGWRMMHVFGWPFDTTQAVWRMIFGGVIDRYPSLKIVTHHCGAMLPFFINRATTQYETWLKDKLPRHISEYWDNFYGDTALGGNVPAYMCGYDFFGADRMLYGSDFPFGAQSGERCLRENLVHIEDMAIPAEDLKKILGENARKLLKIE